MPEDKPLPPSDWQRVKDKGNGLAVPEDKPLPPSDWLGARDGGSG